jgi:hypothetical protein
MHDVCTVCGHAHFDRIVPKGHRSKAHPSEAMHDLVAANIQPEQSVYILNRDPARHRIEVRRRASGIRGLYLHRLDLPAAFSKCGCYDV